MPKGKRATRSSSAGPGPKPRTEKRSYAMSPKPSPQRRGSTHGRRAALDEQADPAQSPQHASERLQISPCRSDLQSRNPARLENLRNMTSGIIDSAVTVTDAHPQTVQDGSEPPYDCPASFSALSATPDFRNLVPPALPASPAVPTTPTSLSVAQEPAASASRVVADVSCEREPSRQRTSSRNLSGTSVRKLFQCSTGAPAPSTAAAPQTTLTAWLQSQTPPSSSVMSKSGGGVLCHIGGRMVCHIGSIQWGVWNPWIWIRIHI